MRKEIKNKIEEEINNIIKAIENNDYTENLKNNSKFAIKLSTILFNLNKIYKKNKINLDRLYNTLYKKYKFNSNLLLKSNQEVNVYIYDTPEYKKIENEIIEIKNLIEYIENILEILKSREYSLNQLLKFYYEDKK